MLKLIGIALIAALASFGGLQGQAHSGDAASPQQQSAETALPPGHRMPAPAEPEQAPGPV